MRLRGLDAVARSPANSLPSKAKDELLLTRSINYNINISCYLIINHLILVHLIINDFEPRL